MALSLSGAYSAAAAVWEAGPGRIYDRLAAVLVARSPVSLAGRSVLDVGAGTGAASRAIAACGAVPIAVDAAVGMLGVARSDRPAAVAGDAVALPVRDSSVDGAVAAFCLNHLTDPALGLRELGRVTRPGGPILVSAYASDDAHPVKQAVERAAAEQGWEPPTWAQALRDAAMPRLATPDRARHVAAAAGLEPDVRVVRVRFDELGPHELVAWRLGMPQLAAFAASLTPDGHARLVDRAIELTGDEPLERSIVVISAVAR